MAIPKAGRVIIYSLLAIIGIILIVFVTALLLDNDSSRNFGAGSIEFIFAAILSTFFLLLSFYLGFLFVRAILMYLGKLAGFSGDTITVRLISLGFIAVIFPRVVSAVILAPIRFFINLISYFISALNNAFTNLGDSYSGVDFTNLFRITLHTLRDTWNLLGKSALQLFYDLRIPDLILAIALWIFIGQMIGYIMRQANQKEERSTFINIIQRINPRTRKNILLTFIFIVSAYLIMCSIIAVPWLQQVNTVFDENWEKELENIAGDQESSLASFGELYSVSPLDTLSNSSLNDLAELDSLPQWQRVVEQLKRNRDDLSQQRIMIIEMWKKMQDEVVTTKSDLLNSAKSSLRINVRGLGPLDQAYYYEEISKWLRINLNSYDQYLDNFKTLVQLFESQLKQWVDETLIAVENDLSGLKLKNRSDNQAIQNFVFKMNSVYNSFNVLSQAVMSYSPGLKMPGIRKQPDPPGPGSQWGIFGLISGWLLRANSYALILITGMLGFGLLGSLISSVVREHSQRKAGEPLVTDLASAVIRGLSAAVVVFLSVKGGLAVFATEEVEPNSYALFFTCLVGAVFSENIWEWARVKLGEKFPPNQQEIEEETNQTHGENDNQDNQNQ